MIGGMHDSQPPRSGTQALGFRSNEGEERREMADQDKRENKSGGQGGTPKESKTGDPGRTPGKAEGDEETADEALGEDDNKALH